MSFQFPTSDKEHQNRGAPKLVSETTFDVDYGWLEWLIQREYGKKLCIVAAWEQGNDTSNSVHVEAVAPTDEWDVKTLREFMEAGKYEYGTPQLVMNELCIAGLLAPGRYIVDICW